MVSREKLGQFSERLRRQSTNSALTITSKGNKLYLLKETRRFYCLVVPNNPLSDTQTLQLKNLLFKEKFAKINLERHFKFYETELIKETISEVLTKILEVPIEREWRIDQSPGMQILKSAEPLTPTSVARQQQIKKNKTFSRQLKNIFFKFLSNLSISIICGITITVIAVRQGTEILTALLIGLLLGSLTYVINKYRDRQLYRKK